jgi:exopolysaccharide biosynthesis polyprenyl glycosylphosphotransferase
VPSDGSLPLIWEEASPHLVGPGRAVALRRDALLRRSLAAADVAAAFGALLILLAVLERAVALRPTAILIAPAVILFAKVLGLYDRDQHLLAKGTIDEVPTILYLSVLYTLGAWLLEEFLFHGWLSRPQVFLLLLLTFALNVLLRALVRHGVLAISPPERCLVLGDASHAVRIRTKLEEAANSKAAIVGRIAPGAQAGPAPEGAVPVVGTVDRISTTVAELDVERIIIAPSDSDQEEILDSIRLIKAHGIKVSVLPRLLEVVGSSSSFDDVNGTLLLGVRHYGLSKSSAFVKRSMDVVVAGVAVLVLSPLFLLTVLAIKLDSRGPVFFRQRRIGARGERFWMLKFRSMVPEAEQIRHRIEHLNEVEGGLFKIAADPRITRVGRCLRKTSVDELPQLLNVLRGAMSLVGPRPLVPDEDALIDGWKRRRLAVRPGMTGLWQIFGSSRVPMHEMVKIDYVYGANWSLWLDAKILLRTVPYMIGRRGV